MRLSGSAVAFGSVLNAVTIGDHEREDVDDRDRDQEAVGQRARDPLAPFRLRRGRQAARAGACGGAHFSPLMPTNASALVKRGFRTRVAVARQDPGDRS